MKLDYKLKPNKSRHKIVEKRKGNLIRSHHFREKKMLCDWSQVSVPIKSVESNGHWSILNTCLLFKHVYADRSSHPTIIISITNFWAHRFGKEKNSKHRSLGPLASPSSSTPRSSECHRDSILYNVRFYLNYSRLNLILDGINRI